MSEKDKDNKDFEFIKEQVIEKKRRKLRKKLLPVLMTIALAILFGLIAAVTFVITEPGLYKLLNKDTDTKTPVDFPTVTPEETGSNTTQGPNTDTQGGNSTNDNDSTETDSYVQNTIVQRINAGLEDYISMYDDIDSVVYRVNKSLVNVESAYEVDDWFGASEKTVNTTGVIVASNTSDYLILVSYDRVENADSVKIKLSGTEYVDAVIQDYEKELNMALLAVTIKDIPALYQNVLRVADLGESYGITVGSPIIAIGNPNGHIGSMEIGIVTSKGSYATVTDNRLELFNTNIQDNDNSDGIIINFDGEIIGLITRTLKADLNKDLSTAIGISKIKTIIIKMGYQQPRMYFGIKADDMTEAAKDQHDITNGIYVCEVQSNSPAFAAGLRDGDIILSINDQSILNTNSFYSIVASYDAGEEVKVKIKRTVGNIEKEMEIAVVLTKKEQ